MENGLKRLTICLAALLCVACDKKDEVQPEWSVDMPSDAVEYFLSLQASEQPDLTAFPERLNAAQFESNFRYIPATRDPGPQPRVKFYFAPDGRCVWLGFIPMSKGDDWICRFRDEPGDCPVCGLADGSCECSEWPVGTWRFDAEQRKILLYDKTGNSMLAELQIGYYVDNRMIATMTYRIDEEHLSPSNGKWPINIYRYLVAFGIFSPYPRYLVGEFSAMTFD